MPPINGRGVHSINVVYNGTPQKLSNLVKFQKRSLEVTRDRATSQWEFLEAAADLFREMREIFSQRTPVDKAGHSKAPGISRAICPPAALEKIKQSPDYTNLLRSLYIFFLYLLYLSNGEVSHEKISHISDAFQDRNLSFKNLTPQLKKNLETILSYQQDVIESCGDKQQLNEAQGLLFQAAEKLLDVEKRGFIEASGFRQIGSELLKAHAELQIYDRMLCTQDSQAQGNPEQIQICQAS